MATSRIQTQTIPANIRNISLSLFFLSATILAFEINLTRLFSVAHLIPDLSEKKSGYECNFTHP